MLRSCFIVAIGDGFVCFALKRGKEGGPSGALLLHMYPCLLVYTVVLALFLTLEYQKRKTDAN